MADTIDASIAETTERVIPPLHEQANLRLLESIALSAILLLSVFMNFFQLGQNGYGNLYYAAAVRSMNDNWQNFFFVSFDPGGFATVDKPPLGFWLQTLSTKFFGFSAFGIFFPQALCGVLAVLLLYSLVRRHFGVVAGLLAALALAVSPISVVTNRNNTIDTTLALVLLLTTWAVIHAAETGKLRWLLLSGVFVGLGFNIKMAEVYLVIPVLVMTYLLCAPRSIWTRIWHLALFTVVVFALSVSWVLAVDLTPAPQRPYVGSTQDNSAISLAFGYNGLNRLRIGQNGTRNNQGETGAPTSNAGKNTGNTANNRQSTQGGGGYFAESGTPSPFRLFGVSLGGQIAWLLPFALLAILALAWQRRFHLQTDRQQLALVLWGMWLLPMAIFFTLDRSFHKYFLTEMAPGLCALFGIGLVIMWQDYRNGGWRGWLLPLTLIVTAATQIYMLTSYPAWSQWLSPVIGILTAVVVIALIILRLRPQFKLSTAARRIAGIAVSIGIFALLITPTVWSGYSVVRNTESSSPFAGPTTNETVADLLSSNSQKTGTTRTGGQGTSTRPSNGGAETNPALISYLEAHQGNTKFLVAVPTGNIGAPLILATNKPVMAMGGFSGEDPILTTSQLQNLILKGTVRFFLINSPRSIQELMDQFPEEYPDILSGRGGGAVNVEQYVSFSNWINNHCSVVPTNAWQSSTKHADPNAGQLYDCANLH
jgi:4-amino-4-deoxy-L-arabinose transferase-like glycosyltransferase